MNAFASGVRRATREEERGIRARRELGGVRLEARRRVAAHERRWTRPRRACARSASSASSVLPGKRMTSGLSCLMYAGVGVPRRDPGEIRIALHHHALPLAIRLAERLRPVLPVRVVAVDDAGAHRVQRVEHEARHGAARLHVAGAHAEQPAVRARQRGARAGGRDRDDARSVRRSSCPRIRRWRRASCRSPGWPTTPTTAGFVAQAYRRSGSDRSRRARP